MRMLSLHRWMPAPQMTILLIPEQRTVWKKAWTSQHCYIVKKSAIPWHTTVSTPIFRRYDAGCNFSGCNFSGTSFRTMMVQLNRPAVNLQLGSWGFEGTARQESARALKLHSLGPQKPKSTSLGSIISFEHCRCRCHTSNLVNERSS
jgi:hypothetical protein